MCLPPFDSFGSMLLSFPRTVQNFLPGSQYTGDRGCPLLTEPSHSDESTMCGAVLPLRTFLTGHAVRVGPFRVNWVLFLYADAPLSPYLSAPCASALYFAGWSSLRWPSYCELGPLSLLLIAPALDFPSDSFYSFCLLRHDSVFLSFP